MEDGNIVVGDGDGSDGHEPSDPPRTWWLAAATLIGLGAAVLILIFTQRPTDELVDNPAEASPVATTTTTTLAIATTTMTPSTTTTIAVGRAIGDATTFMVSDVMDFCVGASPFTNEGERPTAFGDSRLLDADEWTESLSQNDWYLNHREVLDAFEQEVSGAEMALDPDRRNLLQSVATYLRLADDALHDALQALDEGEPDPSWAYHIARIESSCATMMTMLAMSAP